MREGGQRILSLFLPRLQTDRLFRLRRSRPSDAPPEGRPLAIVEKEKNALRVVAVDALAEARGVTLGRSLADARAALPELVVVEADRDADSAVLEGIADWADRYTPLVALDPPRGLFLDISGCAHLFDDGSGNGEAALRADCLRRLARQGFEARAAIAATAGAAWALARSGAGGCIAAGAEAAAIADLPVAALRIEAETAALLERLGLKRIGQLIGKPRAPLAARFGAGLVARLDQALGHRDEVLSPRRPAPRLSAERRFAEPVLDEASLLDAVASLARRLASALERQGLGARRLETAFFRTDGAVARVAIGTAAPLRAAPAMTALFAERLSALASDWDAGFGFDMVRLAILHAETLTEAQIDLSGEADSALGLAHLYDRLSARLGPASVTRFEPADTHIPERAIVARPLSQPAVKNDRQGPNCVTSSSREGRSLRSEAEQGSGGGLAAAATLETETPPDRPLRLFARPEPVEVIAEVPEGPPLRFRWRRVMHEVTRAEGPERIAPEWWRAEDDGRMTRDYFRVESADGRRYWLFREGLYGRETTRPIWYVHGLFA
jgi:protein ImuB